MASGTVRVEGLAALVRDFRKMSPELAKGVQKEINEAAKIVRDDAASAFMHVQPRSAASFRPRVRGATGIVEQRRGTTTGRRGDFGAHQMRYLVRSLAGKSGEVEKRLDQMLDRLAGNNGF